MSIWEAGMLHARGRLVLNGGPRRWVETALRGFPVEEAALAGAVATRSHEIELEHRDPVDLRDRSPSQGPRQVHIARAVPALPHARASRLGA